MKKIGKLHGVCNCRCHCGLGDCFVDHDQTCEHCDFYSLSPLEGRSIVNPETYKGRGRPRKTDYITLAEAQRRINQQHNDYLDRKIRRADNQASAPIQSNETPQATNDKK